MAPAAVGGGCGEPWFRPFGGKKSYNKCIRFPPRTQPALFAFICDSDMMIPVRDVVMRLSHRLLRPLNI